jgi:hypothetical protein
LGTTANPRLDGEVPRRFVAGIMVVSAYPAPSRPVLLPIAILVEIC